MKKRVIVTGSSRGIGRAIAIQLAKDGFDLVVHCRNDRDAAESVKKEILSSESVSEVTILQFDIADRVQCREILEADMLANGAFYGAVCNAGVARDNAFPAIDGEDWDLVVRTNLDGFYNVLHPLIMPMVRAKQGGRIVTLSSVSGLVGNRGQVNYSAAKAGIIGATKSLAIELAKRKITVNCVAPGLIETDMVSELPVDEIKKLIPARRMGKPEEVAGCVSYLFSDVAAYVTRQVISVNGGLA